MQAQYQGPPAGQVEDQTRLVQDGLLDHVGQPLVQTVAPGAVRLFVELVAPSPESDGVADEAFQFLRERRKTFAGARKTMSPARASSRSRVLQRRYWRFATAWR